MTRRELILGGAANLAAAMGPRWIPLNLHRTARRPLRMAVIADLHHGLAPDALSRLNAFCDAVRRRNHLDLVIQMGDFNYSQPNSAECIRLFRDLPHPKIHVLGNHDMDMCDKDTAMRAWGMPARYGGYDFGDYRFVVLDLNHFKKNGQIVSYAKGNYYDAGVTCNWADAEQLRWLEQELRSATKPVILISHQPLGFAEPGQAIPPEQAEVIEIISKAGAANPRGRVAVSMFGHLHVDRLERLGGVPYYCVNSASYFWSSGMYPYSRPLFAFMELTSDGYLKVEGVEASFVHQPPAVSDTVLGRSASLSDRRVPILA